MSIASVDTTPNRREEASKPTSISMRSAYHPPQDTSPSKKSFTTNSHLQSLPSDKEEISVSPEKGCQERSLPEISLAKSTLTNKPLAAASALEQSNLAVNAVSQEKSSLTHASNAKKKVISSYDRPASFSTFGNQVDYSLERVLHFFLLTQMSFTTATLCARSAPRIEASHPLG